MGLIKTGIRGLDELLGGGFLPGSVILLAGHPGTGKTTFGAQFLLEGLKNGERGIYVSFVESKEEFYRHMRLLGMDFAKYEEEGLFYFIEASPPPSIPKLESCLKAIVERIIKQGARRVVIDSISALISAVDEKKSRFLLQAVLMKPLKNLNVTLFLIAELPIGNEVIGYGFEEFLTDVVLKMIAKEERGITRRFLIIHKVREAPIPRLSYEFVIEEGKGIRLYTPLKVGLEGSYRLERVTIGIPELDKLFGGGIYRGSTTLLAGPTGSGKTFIALKFAVAGAERGEKTYYISFEESVEQLSTMLKTMNVSLKTLNQKLRIISLSARLSTPGAIYSYISRLIEEEEIHRIILDGASALERHYTRLEYLELLRNLSLMFKLRGVTALITSLKDVFHGEESEVSTICDNIIALWWEKENDMIKHKMTIIKARGMKHDKRIHEFRFENGDIVIS